MFVGEADRQTGEKLARRYGAVGYRQISEWTEAVLEEVAEETLAADHRYDRMYRLSRAIEHAPEGVVISDATDPDQPIVYCNSAFRRMTGYDRSEVIGRNCRFLQCDETDPETVDAIRDAVEDQRPVTVELLNERRDGERFWNKLSIAPIRDPTGEVTEFVGFQSDVTRRVEAERRLERYELVVENAADPIVLKDRDGRFLLVNEPAAENMGAPRDEIVGKLEAEILGEALADRIRRHRHEAIDQDRPVRKTMTMDLPEGKRVLDVTRVPFRERDEIRGTVGVARDVTEQHELRRQLEERALYDEVTGLPNRQYFDDRSTSVASEAIEVSEPMAVAVLELDDFNAVNESFGRKHGDAFLTTIAHRLEETIGDADTVARIGGDEFALLLDSVRSEDDFEGFARRLDETFTAPVEIEETPVHVSFSLGLCDPVAITDGTQKAPDALVKHALKTAGQAANRAKSVRGNSWRIAVPDTDHGYDARIEFENRLRQAIADDEFVPFVQPIYKVSDGTVWAAEVLARWRHPDRGLVSPGEFIPVAARSGLLQAITEQIIRKAGTDLASKGRPPGWSEQTRLYVNLSPSQVARRDIVERLSEVVETHVPDDIETSLEITEDQFLERCEQIEALREMGFRIIVDDFGTGYSSLTRIKELPMAELKLDMQFVHGAVDHDDDRAILETVIDMGRNLGIPVIGEGVETDDQFELLRETGCTAVQGYLFDRPAPIDAFRAGADDSVSAVD